MIHLNSVYKNYAGGIQAVRGVSLKLEKNKTIALVGESGCGKSTIAKMILGLEQPSSGKIYIQDQDISTMTQKQIASKVQMVFQDPASSLNPRQKVFDIIAEPLMASGVSKEFRAQQILEVASKVGLTKEMLERYPHTFSGGQKQRIGIARALVTKPQILICDEPVSALDVSIQAQILNLLIHLQKTEDLTILFVSHDLGVVQFIADQVAVMYLGKIVESGNNEEVFQRASHPYTQLLLQSSPRIGVGPMDIQLTADELPSSKLIPEGCSFRSRCIYKMENCVTEPELKKCVDPGNHFVACCKI